MTSNNEKQWDKKQIERKNKFTDSMLVVASWVVVLLKWKTGFNVS